MRFFLTRLKCPKCGKGLSRLAIAPSWPIYPAMFPSLKVPFWKICSIIAIGGLALGLIHPLLAIAFAIGVGAWSGWKYFFPLQCDGCGTYYISGQFVGDKEIRIPWTAGDTRTMTGRVVIWVAIFVGVLLLIFLPDRWIAAKCSENCKAVGLVAQAPHRVFQCDCVAPQK